MPLLPGVIRALFDYEDNPVRFERVCTEICSALTGTRFVPTSVNYDMGRDGRQVSPGSREIPGILCATLRSDLDTKIEEDLTRLSTTTRTKALYYFTSQPITEQAADRLEADIRRRFRSLETVRVLGRVQLESLGEQFEDILRRHYSGEIQNIEQTLLRAPLSQRPEHTALRLALVTQTGDDASVLRQELTRRLVLEALVEKGALGSGQLAAHISQGLHLAHAVSREYIEQVVTDLARENFVEVEATSVRLNEAGRRYLEAVPAEATAKLLEGRSAVRAAIKNLSNHSLAESQFETLWRTLQDSLSDLFWSHGHTIVRMVSSLISGAGTGPTSDERALLEQLADKIRALFGNPEQADEVRQAIIDMFSQKDSEAFRWLTQVSSVYVMMCSLGFEALSSQEITKLLRTYQLVTDSDITISLLCQREENHEEVVRVLRGWRALGGSLFAAVPVLEEAAYHAWISERDYQALGEELYRMTDLDASRIIYNAFVRTYRKLRGEGPIAWHQFIKEYRGRDERDFRPILSILKEEEGFVPLPPAESKFDEFAKRVKELILQLRAGQAHCRPEELDFRVRDKAARDAALVAAVRTARDSARESGGGPTMIVSSSGLLKEVDATLRHELGEPELVVSTAAVACLLTLVPGVQMGLGTLRGVLFDLGLAERLRPVDRYAYRIITLSGQWDLPWSRRVTLRKELGARLLADAKARGKPIAELVERVLRGEDPEFSAKLVVDTLDNMAVKSSAEREKAVLVAEIERLKKRIAELESSGR
jgi:hypothetical protein